MEFVGYGFAIVMGLTLGLIGGGGSILTVPILVYMLGVSATNATAYSLFVVGVSSFTAAVDYVRRGLIDFKIGVLFVIPSFVGVYAVRRFLIPVLPHKIIEFNGFYLTKDSLILIVFSMVMLIAAVSMIKGRKEFPREKKDRKIAIVILEGLLVGSLTGFVGAGGGFLIVPTLILITGLETKVAIGTSLFIITIKSLIGFVGDWEVTDSMNWMLLGTFSSLSIIGIFLGTYFSRRVDGKILKPIFGWFVLLMGSFMLVKELLFAKGG